MYKDDLIKSLDNNIDFYDDYAHHPTEIKVVLDGVNKVYKDFEKVCIFSLIEFHD